MKEYFITMNSPTGWKAGCPVFEVWERDVYPSLCECRNHEVAKSICNALEKSDTTDEEINLTLGELITHLKEVEDDPMKLEVVFDTCDRSDLTLLSCYVHGGRVHIDIGTGEE